MSVDWLNDYEEKFAGNAIIANLKRMKFHGKVTINFSEGSPHASHVEWFTKPYTKTVIPLGGDGKDGGEDTRTAP